MAAASQVGTRGVVRAVLSFVEYRLRGAANANSQPELQIAHGEASRFLRHSGLSPQIVSTAKNTRRAIAPAHRLLPIVQCKRVTETSEDCVPLSGGRPCSSNAVTVTVYVPCAVELLTETVSAELADATLATVAGGGVVQDGAG